MIISLHVEGSEPETMPLHAFFVANCEAFTPGEMRRIRAQLLQHGGAVFIGGGAAPLVELKRAD